MDIVVYHNPDCGTSRNALALIRHAGIEPHVIEYLKTPPTRALLLQLAARAGWPLCDLLREKGTPFKELGLGDLAVSDDTLLDAVAAHPILINRPLVVSPLGVALCRPSEIVLDLLPVAPRADLDKDDGTPFLRDEQIAADDPRLAKALREAGLPTGDPATEDIPIGNLPAGGMSPAAGRVFSFRTLGGTLVGYGEFAPAGGDALLRSLLVKPEWRGKGAGRNMLLLLQRRAFDAGARRLWLPTDTAAAYFEKLGFTAAAPPAIAGSAQARTPCPSSAALLSRRIVL